MKALTAICSLILSSFVLAPPMLAQTPAGVRLESGIAKEDVDGDLKSAIDIYQKIAADASAPRDVRSKALLRLAGCYEKLGRQATQVYEQVVHDFADQPAATQARNRLAALRLGASSAPATMTQRRIDYQDTGVAAGTAFVRTDGQHALYKDEATGALVIRDLATGSKRVILRPQGTMSAGVVASRDLSRVAISMRRPDGSSTMAVLKTDGSGYREIGSLVGTACKPEWSWDDRYLLLCERTSDGYQYLRFSFPGGESRKLFQAKSENVLFSPDGRFIAYNQGAKLLIIPADGGEPRLVANDYRLLDWTSDGRYLAVYGHQSGAGALFLLPMKDGKAAGETIFVRYGNFAEGRIVSGGALVSMLTSSGGNALNWLSSLGSDGHVQGWNALPLFGGTRDGHDIHWSPDSNQIAYRTQNLAAGLNTFSLRVRNINTGEDHQIYQARGDTLRCSWATHEPMLYCGESGSQDTEIFSIATDSGDVKRLGSVPGRNLPLMASRDGRSIYMGSGEPPDLGLAKWDIATQQLTSPDPDQHLETRVLLISPDERWTARRISDNYEIRNLSGGDWTPVGPLGGLNGKAFTPDGNWIVYYERAQHALRDEHGKNSLFRVGVSGGQPERLGDFPDASSGGFLHISPDGKKIIASYPGTDAYKGAELWLLENFEPKQQAAK
jgi:Tol biopolymer transport system component